MKLPKNVGGRLGQFLDLRGNGKKKGGAGGGAALLKCTL